MNEQTKLFIAAAQGDAEAQAEMAGVAVRTPGIPGQQLLIAELYARMSAAQGCLNGFWRLASALLYQAGMHFENGERAEGVSYAAHGVAIVDMLADCDHREGVMSAAAMLEMAVDATEQEGVREEVFAAAKGYAGKNLACV